MVSKDQVNYQPVAGYLLLRPLEDENLKIGFVIKDEDELPQKALVLAVGNDVKREQYDDLVKAPCKVGDEIIHSGYGFENIKINGVQYRLCPFYKVLAIKNEH